MSHGHDDSTQIAHGPDGGAPTSRAQWRSLEERSHVGPLPAELLREFQDGADELEMTDVSRRSFMGLMGASLALAGAATGCSKLPIRKPVETILPYAKRPEDLIPGSPTMYATSAWFGGTVLGLLVESQDGRPTKVEGNPRHPLNAGATHAFAQASVLDVYDPDRSATPLRDGSPASWADLGTFLESHFGALRSAGGRGLAILADAKPSPTLDRLIGQALEALPQARLYRHDSVLRESTREALAALGAPGVLPLPNLEQADVVFAADCDYLGLEGDVVRNAQRHAARRSTTRENRRMNRLYVVEPSFTTTGMMADHRRRVRGADVRGFLEALAKRVFALGAPVPAGAEGLVAGLTGAPGAHGDFIEAVAKDLMAVSGQSLVLVGERQPAAVHVLGHLLNAALGAPGATLGFGLDPLRPAGSLAELASAAVSGAVETLLVLGRNPVKDAPGDLGFAAAWAKVPTRIHFGALPDETGQASSWHVPAAHDLESWGDLVASDGTVSLQQPLILPLYGGLTDIELVGRLVAGGAPAGYDLVRQTWQGAESFDAGWRRWLHDGVVAVGSPLAPPALTFGSAAGLLANRPEQADGFELNFHLSTSVHDGRHANNAWLQELPDPMTKLAWDNAACISPATARALGVKKDGDALTITVGETSLTLPAISTPGVVDDAVILTLGYGRTAGHRVSQGVGFDVTPLRTAASPWFRGGARVERTSGSFKLARTQMHHTLEEPITHHVRDSIVRETTLAEFREHPESIAAKDPLPPSRLHSLWEEPNVRGGQQWGMTIDLNTCIGCNACTVACQAENNIPVVGKERVVMGREMHWIRLDRYYTGGEDEPEAVVQPLPCMQCENAPCEQVCPVAATTHSPEGLNDMAYNRCIGTRYCANNCPYKVRRFNYFNFAKEQDESTTVTSQAGTPVPLIAFQRNPDVTVRFRGVMEKCTYCTQRISQARIASKVSGNRTIPDGGVVPACAQACPPRAITFGDINDETSAVSRLKAEARNYSLLSELNTKPRTTYLARVRNPNPALVKD